MIIYQDSIIVFLATRQTEAANGAFRDPWSTKSEGRKSFKSTFYPTRRLTAICPMYEESKGPRCSTLYLALPGNRQDLERFTYTIRTKIAKQDRKIDETCLVMCDEP